MYTASSVLVKRKFFRSRKKRLSNKTKIYCRNKRHRFYYPDRDYYRNVYLKSEHWADLRKRKLTKDNVCERCGSSKRIEPHHKRYRNLYDVKLSDLETLCRRCHIKEHKKKR